MDLQRIRGVGPEEPEEIPDRDAEEVFEDLLDSAAEQAQGMAAQNAAALRLAIGKLPGDFRFRLFGREFFIPLTSSVVLSLVALGISKLL